MFRKVPVLLPLNIEKAYKNEKLCKAVQIFNSFNFIPMSYDIFKESWISFKGSLARLYPNSVIHALPGRMCQIIKLFFHLPSVLYEVIK